MERVAIVAITKKGIITARKLGTMYPKWHVYAPAKLDDGNGKIEWFEDQVSKKLGILFAEYEGLLCIFSLGAVIRLLAPHLKDKKTDPAVLVIDDACEFVISALSGHVGGANELARQIATKVGATPVITTAADVNKTIAVDLVGRNLGWKIDGDKDVTTVSAMMVNEQSIGVYQDAGEDKALGQVLPANVTKYPTLDALLESKCAGMLVITDRIINPLTKPAVIYRPKSLAVGVGVHGDTKASKILESLYGVLETAGLSIMSVACLASVKKPKNVAGLQEAADTLGIELRLYDRENLAKEKTPNPSDIVKKLEGTPSVSEASALLCADNTELVIQKQKFPPDLTLAVARMIQ